jgi:hypothetical protein
MIEFGQTPIDEAQLQRNMFKGPLELRRISTDLAMFMIDHNIMGLNITMHDALGMTIVKCLWR